MSVCTLRHFAGLDERHVRAIRNYTKLGLPLIVPTDNDKKPPTAKQGTRHATLRLGVAGGKLPIKTNLHKTADKSQQQARIDLSRWLPAADNVILCGLI